MTIHSPTHPNATTPFRDEHGHDPHGTGEDHGSYVSYSIGFALSVVLTVAAFWLVMGSGFGKPVVFAGIAILAVVQVVVHLYFFLHLNFSSERRWNVVAFAFAAGVVFLLVTGSLWIMFNINEHMVGDAPGMKMIMGGPETQMQDPLSAAVRVPPK